MQCEGMGHDSMCNSFHCDFLRRFIRSVMYIVCNEVERVLAASRWGGGRGGGGVADDLLGAIGAVYGLCNICFNNFFVDVSSIIN